MAEIPEVDLTKSTLTPLRCDRQANFYLNKRRTDDLLRQVEKLKPLLLSTDPEIVLRASQEIREIHEAITEICKAQAATLPESIRIRRRKRIFPKKEKKPKPRDENIFRPQ